MRRPSQVSRLDPVSRRRGSDEELLRALHDEHGAALWRYALHLTGGDRSRAEDVVQETLLRAWRHPEVLTPERGISRGWLWTVARHLVIDEARSARWRHEEVSGRLPERPVADEADRVVDRELLAIALGRLSAEHRDVLRECYYRGRSVAEAAAVLGVPAGTVKSRTHYALRALRLAIEELGGVE